MNNDAHPKPTIIVIFGAGGDLTHRKLVPALYNLFTDGWMPEHFAILGMDQSAMSEDQFRNHLREGVDHFSSCAKTEDAQWQKFIPHVFFQKSEFASAPSFVQLKEWLAAREKQWNTAAEHIFYLAVPPALIETIGQQLSQADLLTDRQKARLVVEKPFGTDLESARKLNRILTKSLDESQIYRIDHYLGKETVQNILAFRFANSLFEPIWNRRYIDHVQITVAEDVGVEHRGHYYEGAGAVRDMLQNHLLQILCHIAMEPPVTYAADEIRNKKVDVLRAIRPIPPQQVSEYAVRGQYAAGSIDDKPVVGYRQEETVAAASTTETYAALQLFVDNWRWQDVPFYLRTGKRLPTRVSEACIQFRPVPHRSFPLSNESIVEPNHLAIRIVPNEGIVLRFEAKYPGHRLLLRPVFMRFSYQDSFDAPAREAYETLLRDVMLGDQTLFMRADQVEAAWAVVMPILTQWESTPPNDFPNYAAGSWGPKAADQLLARDGRRWLCTILPQDGDEIPENKP